MDRKRKIVWLSDHPLVPSGVGLQAKYSIEGLLETGKYEFFCLGGAIKHPDYRIQQVAPEKFGEGSWMILPVDGHGTKEQLREVLKREKPDAVVMFTDPRFFYWVWEMEDEVRAQCPLVYWHVWDNDPIPDFNKILYDSTDYVAALSLKTYGILQGVGYDPKRFCYLPHAEHDELFKPLPEDVVDEHKRRHFGPFADREFIAFWNNRNARRKMTGDVIESFVTFAKKAGRSKVALLMHTQSGDPEGQDIHALVKKLGADDLVFLSEDRVSSEQINMFYNCADVTINISSNEGFGLSTLESMFAGTPIVVNFTGGLQFQVGAWWEGLEKFDNQFAMTSIAKRRWADKLTEWYGVPVFPAARNNVGSQAVPYIYDDRVNNDDVAEALTKMFKMGRTKRKELGAKARSWAMREFSMKRMVDGWNNVLTTAIDRWSSEPRGPRVADI